MHHRSRFPLAVLVAVVPTVWASSASAEVRDRTEILPSGVAAADGTIPAPGEDVTSVRATYDTAGSVRAEVTFAAPPDPARPVRVDMRFSSYVRVGLCGTSVGSPSGLVLDATTGADPRATIDGGEGATVSASTSGATLTIVAEGPGLKDRGWSCASMMSSPSVAGGFRDGAILTFPNWPCTGAGAPAPGVPCGAPTPETPKVMPAPTPAAVRAEPVRRVHRGSRTRLRLVVAAPSNTALTNPRVRLTLPRGVRAEVDGRLRAGSATLRVPSVKAGSRRHVGVTLRTSRSTNRSARVVARTTAPGVRLTTSVPLRLR